MLEIGCNSREDAEKYIGSMSDAAKDTLYRALRAEYVEEDVRAFLEGPNGDDYRELPDKEYDALVKAVVDRYVYDGDYDCNLSYWENLELLVGNVAAQMALS